jgi:type IV secretory pathway VirB10-like protein
MSHESLNVLHRALLLGEGCNRSADHLERQLRQAVLAREKQRHDSLNSDTVAVDFSQPTTEHPAPAPIVAEDHHAARPATDTPEKPEPKDAAIDKYDFDSNDGKLYRIFESSVFEGVVTNHIDGGLAGPILIMLTTDYYSHDHQQLLLPPGTRLMPPGTRLIGSVQAVNSSQARKMVVTFHRAICPVGFSVDLDKFAGLDPLGTTGLATKVDNHNILASRIIQKASSAFGGVLIDAARRRDITCGDAQADKKAARDEPLATGVEVLLI